MTPRSSSRRQPSMRSVAALQYSTRRASSIATIASLISSGFYPESAVSAVEANDFIGLLQHTGLTSVQLQKPGTTQEKP